MNNYLGLLFIALSFFLAGVFIKTGIQRAGAIQAGMTAIEYIDWIDEFEKNK